MPPELTSSPRSRGNTADYPKDGTYESQLEWVRNRGYPEDGTHEAKLEWVRANGQLPPYPRQGTPLEKNAWARLSTAYLTDTSDTKWYGEDLSEPLVVFTVNRGSGEVVSLRLVPRQQPRAQRRRTVRRTRAQARSPGSKDPPEPEPPLEVAPALRVISRAAFRLDLEEAEVVSCPTAKRPLDAETAADEARRLRLRPYLCPRCGGWHLTKRRGLRPKVPTLSARECEAVWSL